MAERVNQLSGEQAVNAAHIHERGYRDWKAKGLSAREPYYLFTWQLEAWRKGYQKAKREDRVSHTT